MANGRHRLLGRIARSLSLLSLCWCFLMRVHLLSSNLLAACCVSLTLSPKTDISVSFRCCCHFLVGGWLEKNSRFDLPQRRETTEVAAAESSRTKRGREKHITALQCITDNNGAAAKWK